MSQRSSRVAHRMAQFRAVAVGSEPHEEMPK
jgi:hypothetical protein